MSISDAEKSALYYSASSRKVKPDPCGWDGYAVRIGRFWINLTR